MIPPHPLIFDPNPPFSAEPLWRGKIVQRETELALQIVSIKTFKKTATTETHTTQKMI